MERERGLFCARDKTEEILGLATGSDMFQISLISTVYILKEHSTAQTMQFLHLKECLEARDFESLSALSEVWKFCFV